MLDKIALAFAIAGCLYLGIAGIFNLELFHFELNNLFCLLTRFIYAIIGVCGFWCISFYFKFNKKRRIELN